MSAITFDTHKFIKKLQEAGMSPIQAEAVADAQREALSSVFETNMADLATKAGLREVELRLEARFAKLEGDAVLVKWMLSILLAGVASLILKAFF